MTQKQYNGVHFFRLYTCNLSVLLTRPPENNIFIAELFRQKLSEQSKIYIRLEIRFLIRPLLPKVFVGTLKNILTSGK